ncbi:MAG: ATP-binding protein [Deferrisomatales bacterium]|nr:ATP-binding protein [Deferrisomatales bacterium]
MSKSHPPARAAARRRSLYQGALLVLVVGLVDLATGIELSAEILYVGPVYFVAWRAGLGHGIALAAWAALTWLAADHLGGHRYLLPQAPYWNALGGFLVFAVLAFVTDRSRTLLAERESARRALTRKSLELARSNTELEQYAAAAAHDLKSPLVAVLGYLQLLRRRFADRLGPDGLAYLDQAARGAERMETLICDLLSYSKVGRGGQEPVPVEAGTALEEALANLAAEIEACGARVTHDPLPAVPGHPTELVQLFQNLVGNALKFRGGEPPRVHVGVEEHPGEWVFAVRDNGIGIDPADRERIFRLFERLWGASEYPGTGIGLAICRKIVETRGGRIWVEESEPGGGTTFRFTVPRPRDLP